jgi:hypothetical protein
MRKTKTGAGPQKHLSRDVRPLGATSLRALRKRPHMPTKSEKAKDAAARAGHETASLSETLATAKRQRSLEGKSELLELFTKETKVMKSSNSRYTCRDAECSSLGRGSFWGIKNVKSHIVQYHSQDPRYQTLMPKLPTRNARARDGNTNNTTSSGGDATSSAGGGGAAVASSEEGGRSTTGSRGPQNPDDMAFPDSASVAAGAGRAAARTNGLLDYDDGDGEEEEEEEEEDGEEGKSKHTGQFKSGKTGEVHSALDGDILSFMQG